MPKLRLLQGPTSSQDQKIGQKAKVKVQSNSANEKGVLKPRAYKFALETIRFLDNLNQKDFTVQTISKQLLRSSTSIGANITEAQAGSSRKDFTNFYTHALKSANETQYWLRLLIDSGKSDNQQSTFLLQEASELAKMLASSVLTLKQNRAF